VGKNLVKTQKTFKSGYLYAIEGNIFLQKCNKYLFPYAIMELYNQISEKARPRLRLLCFLEKSMRQGEQIFDSYKRRGEWVELLFMTVAAGMGFNVAKPWGEPPRYDVIVEREGRFLRVQVKSTEMWLGTCYLCQLYSYGRQPYTPKETDYFAIYVFPVDVWYIFPAKVLAGMRTIALTPHLKGHKYEPYMENWRLLTNSRRRAAKDAPSPSQRPTSVRRLTERITKRLRGLDR
jgi:PD-(D/E)XK endonuclease